MRAPDTSAPVRNSARRTSSHRRIAITVALVAALAIGATPARASEAGAGIYVKIDTWSTTVINLTNYTLDVTADTLEEHDGCCSGGCGSPPFATNGGPVGPMRAWTDSVGNDRCDADPQTWSGTVTFGFTGSYLSDSSFQIVFVRQQAADTSLDHAGSWIALQPTAENSAKWSSHGTTLCGVTATPYGDNKMHNVMNLVSAKIQITLYSMDNRNVVLVARQTDESASTSGWNDCAYYVGVPVDFVDNGSDVVPQ